MTKSIRAALMIVLASGPVFFGGATAFGQSRDRAAERDTMQDPTFHVRAFDERLNDIDFKGGRLEEYLDKLRTGTLAFNLFVLREEGIGENDPQLPAIRLSRVTTRNAVELVDRQRFGAFVVMTDIVAGEQGVPIVRVNVARAVPIEQESTEPVLRVYRLNDLFKMDDELENAPAGRREPIYQRKANEIVEVINLALDMTQDRATPFQLNLHPNTRILLFRGTPRQAQTIDELMSAILPDVPLTAPTPSTATQNSEERNARARLYQQREEFMRELAIVQSTHGPDSPLAQRLNQRIQAMNRAIEQLETAIESNARSHSPTTQPR
jgi:hypothetical protein